MVSPCSSPASSFIRTETIIEKARRVNKWTQDTTATLNPREKTQLSENQQEQRKTIVETSTPISPTRPEARIEFFCSILIVY